MADPKPIRCAVYTRKSSEEGLEQSFNSLHAQREACEAYILSQKHEGWQLVPTAYDDGGFSGGSMGRPGLQALLADVEAGLVDTIVVYKVDRLTRSLSDFAKMVELFDSKNASFVSVTQAFNTTTSMGRLTLNVLLSFAQFEREVTGERIRDKIAASKAKGMWMGGIVPLGYDCIDRELVINEAEAEQVRTLFRLYLKVKAVDAVAERAALLGIKSKTRLNRAGEDVGGMTLARGSIYKILENPIYVGLISHKGKEYPGLHAPIVDRKLFDAAQKVLAGNRTKKLGSVTAAVPPPLAGLVWREGGEKLISTHTSKGKLRYRYYADDKGRIPAKELESVVLGEIIRRFSSPKLLAQLLPKLEQYSDEVRGNAAAVAAKLKAGNAGEIRAFAVELIDRIDVAPEMVAISIKMEAIGAAGVASINVPASVGRSPAKLSLVVPGSAQRAPDPGLIGLVAQARNWFGDLAAGQCTTFRAVADRHGVSEAYVRQNISAAFLAPDLVERIVEGRQPATMTLASFKEMLPLPASWEAQRACVAALN
ncbi:MAG: recombinase family protein [Sphingomonas sp.]|uniref:recombinase family protein n=1 Tax=Sphingomonas sp. TaxID=28214 RepID=UPI003F7E6451